MKMGEPVDWKAEHAKLSAGNAELVQKLAWSKETYDALAAELASTKALWHEASGAVRLQAIRISALEAALREIASHVGEDSQLDINAKNMRDAAREALATAETKGEPKMFTQEHHPAQGELGYVWHQGCGCSRCWQTYQRLAAEQTACECTCCGPNIVSAKCPIHGEQG